ncbi:MAG: protein kinase [Lachnospiraceae bacterium]|nr:protein kinase [Lachnospiraceae bacterium]
MIEEYISGTPLNELMASKNLNLSLIEKIMSDLCSIVSRLHMVSPAIIHRDIKPSNVIVGNDGYVALLDFNAAKQFTENATKDTVLLGTEGYAAPEQYGFGSSSPQTDIYALGILFKEMLQSSNISLFPYKKIIDKCTHINPDERYRSVEEFREALSLKLPDSSGTDSKRNTLASFIPPGYRSHKPLKMLLATFGYIVLLDFFLTLKIENTNGISLWIERIAMLLATLSIIFISYNYRDVWDVIPFAKSKYKTLRIISIITFDIIIALAIIIAMLSIESLLLKIIPSNFI